ncbi:hypothetical protein [Tenacibaculum jejuense]|uniref:Probable lipoprotein n=1 Tax=Tenacibaculum jejuense TaxID=584609 RepID=A0A238UE79_9FLAO|nr:hypothetical protein [Tenacibaculum jejuense]SNR16784.1 Probable lipoprotein precursor [Tenacibaculum jejuense]
MKTKGIIILLCFCMLLSCRKQEDKYPDVPYFTENFSEDIKVESSYFVESFLTDTDVFIYTFSNNFEIKEHKIHIRDKKSKQIIKEFEFDFRYGSPRNNILVDKIGTIYFTNKKSCYKISPPLFEKIKVKEIETAYLEYMNVVAANKKAYEQIPLDSTLYNKNTSRNNFIVEKQKELVEQKLLKDYKEILCNERNYIIRYNNGEELFLSLDSINDIVRNFDLILKDKKKATKNQSKSSYQDFTNKNFTLTDFDDRILYDYDVDWMTKSNRFFPDYSTKYLYYKEIKIGEKVYRFKTHAHMNKAISFNRDILISTYGKTYKLTLK